MLKVGLLIGGKVSGVITRRYQVSQFKPYDVTVFVNAEAVGWKDYVNFYSWGGSHTGASWPGDRVTTTRTVGGKQWFCKSYTMTSADDFVNLVFSIGTSSTASQNQTVDINSITHDAYYEITGDKEESKYLAKDVTATMGIDDAAAESQAVQDDHYYTLSGQRVSQPLRRGIYLHKGKKILVK